MRKGDSGRYVRIDHVDQWVIGVNQEARDRFFTPSEARELAAEIVQAADIAEARETAGEKP